MNYLTAINKVLEHEGGFVDHKSDPGGATNFGITKRVYEAFKGRKVSITEMKNMPKSDAVAIYKANYWDAIQGDLIKSYKIAFAMFDQAVNRGVSAAIKSAQKIIGAIQDGRMGAATLSTINGFNEEKFLSQYLADAIQAYQAIVDKKPSSAVFLKGWLNRVQSISDYVKVKPAVAAGSLVLFLIIGFFLVRILSSKGKK
jgi:lysozyme family protein